MIKKECFFSSIMVFLSTCLIQVSCFAAPTPPTKAGATTVVTLPSSMRMKDFDGYVEDKNEWLGILLGIGAPLASVGLVMFSPSVQGLINKKISNSSIFGEEQNRIFFEHSTQKFKEKEKFIENILTDFKALKKEQENNRSAREKELLSKLEREVARANAAVYKARKEEFVDNNQAIEKEIDELSNQSVAMESTGESAQQSEETAEPKEHEFNNKHEQRLVILKAQRDENLAHIKKMNELNNYYLSASQGKDHEHLVSHPEVKSEIAKNRQEFAEKIISSPTIFKNLTERTKQTINDQKRWGNRDHMDLRKPKEILVPRER